MRTNTPAIKRAILIRNAAEYDFGGAERFVVGIAKELAANGWQATIVTAHKKVYEHAVSDHVPVRKGLWWQRQDWSGKRILLTPLYFAWQLVLTLWYLQLFARQRPNVVHAQSKDDFIAATIAARLVGARVIWTDHADLKYVYQNVGVWYKNPVGKIVRACSRLAHAITLVSQSEGTLVSKALDAELPANYRVIYNGITDCEIPVAKRAPQDKDALVFCATSRLVTAKGIGELITAFQQIADNSMQLWLLGEGPEEATFRQQAAGDARIRFLGFPSNSLSILRSADIFVHPSYHEGFSLSLIEAAMLQKPIIACNVGGNPEIVKDHITGLLIPEKDADALATAMQTLAKEAALRDKLAAAARQTYEQHFQFNVIVKESFIPAYEGK